MTTDKTERMLLCIRSWVQTCPPLAVRKRRGGKNPDNSKFAGSAHLSSGRPLSLRPLRAPATPHSSHQVGPHKVGPLTSLHKAVPVALAGSSRAGMAPARPRSCRTSQALAPQRHRVARAPTDSGNLTPAVAAWSISDSHFGRFALDMKHAKSPCRAQTTFQAPSAASSR